MSEAFVKQSAPTCRCFGFFIAEQIIPTLALSLILPSIAVGFAAALKGYKQIIGIGAIICGDDLQVGDGDGLNVGADRKVGGGEHCSSVVDSYSIGDGWGVLRPPCASSQGVTMALTLFFDAP